MMSFGWLFFVLLVVGGVFLAVWLVKSLNAGAGAQLQAARSSSAQEILRQRYAKGEIDKEQYDQMKADLS